MELLLLCLDWDCIVVEIHKDGEMVGFWVQEKSGKNVQMVSTAWRHGGWPPGASAVAVLLQVEFVVR